MALADAGVHAVLIVRSVAGDRGDRTGHLVEQGANLRAVVGLAAGQGRGDDPPGVGIHAEVQHFPRPACLGAMFLDQPLPGPHSFRPVSAWTPRPAGIVAATLTDRDEDDASQVGPLLDQVADPVASFTSDGAYDQESVYADVAERHPGADVVVPPRSTAVPSATAETAPTQRDCHLQLIAEKGRMGWQKASGYNVRARAEAAIGRFKGVSATGCARARTSVRRPR